MLTKIRAAAAAVKPYRKAIAGGIAGGFAAYGTALTDGTVTQQEWVGVVLAVLGGAGIVFAAPKNVPNKAPTD